jgi:hypothetical protein
MLKIQVDTASAASSLRSFPRGADGAELAEAERAPLE